jgi:hypothetical protein
MLCLAITDFAVDPDRVTDLLRIVPTTVARKGTHARSGRPHQSNGWWLEARNAEVLDGGSYNEALNRLIEQLSESADRFATLREVLRPA